MSEKVFSFADPSSISMFNILIFLPIYIRLTIDNLLTVSFIVQAYQKDTYVGSLLDNKLNDLINSVKGQLFVNKYNQEISVISKLSYLLLIAYKGIRTLGEDYVDLIYVNRKGTKLVTTYKRFIFVLFYTVLPYILSKLVKQLNKTRFVEAADNSIRGRLIKCLRKICAQEVLDSALAIHLMIFCFKGEYYELSRRLFGLRYAIGHKIENFEKEFREYGSRSYKILGLILYLQIVSKSFSSISNLVKTIFSYIDKNVDNKNTLVDTDKDSTETYVDLDDGDQLPFIPDQSRQCTLCLTKMINPSCAPCGHIYCWNCIVDWCKEKPECPLCRQKCLKQNILPII